MEAFTDKLGLGWNHYNNDDGRLVRYEVVPVSEETKFCITGLEEGQKYYVRVSAYGEGDAFY